MNPVDHERLRQRSDATSDKPWQQARRRRIRRERESARIADTAGTVVEGAADVAGGMVGHCRAVCSKASVAALMVVPDARLRSSLRCSSLFKPLSQFFGDVARGPRMSILSSSPVGHVASPRDAVRTSRVLLGRDSRSAGCNRRRLSARTGSTSRLEEPARSGCSMPETVKVAAS